MSQQNDKEYEMCLQRVEEVESILGGLKSCDNEIAEIATHRAVSYFKTADLKWSILDDVNEMPMLNPNMLLPIQDNIKEMPINNFKNLIEEGSENRLQMRITQKRKANQFKNEGDDAFREENYDEALHCYSKAIEETSDDYLLYTKRAETLINLGVYHRALADCETSLKLNDNCLKALMHKAEAYYKLNEGETTKDVINTASHLHPDKKEYISGWYDSWKENSIFGLDEQSGPEDPSNDETKAVEVYI